MRRHCVNRLPKFNTVFIDNSSTCLALAKKIDFTNKTVITNGLQIALQLLNKRDIQLIVPCGSVNTSTSAITGSAAEKFLETLNIDLMLASCASVNAESVCELSFETARFKSAAMSRCKRRILIAAKNKFSNDAPYITADPKNYDFIITNADDKTISPLTERGVTVFNK